MSDSSVVLIALAVLNLLVLAALWLRSKPADSSAQQQEQQAWQQKTLKLCRHRPSGWRVNCAPRSASRACRGGKRPCRR